MFCLASDVLAGCGLVKESGVIVVFSRVGRVYYDCVLTCSGNYVVFDYFDLVCIVDLFFAVLLFGMFWMF